MRIFRTIPVVSAVCAALLTVGMLSAINGAGAASQKIIKVPIAVLASETGSLAIPSTPDIQAAEYAVSQINKTGFKVRGKTYKFALTVKNDNSDPATSVEDATGLIDNHIVAMFGPFGTDAPPVATLTSKAKVILFDPDSSLAATSGPPSNPYTFVTSGDPLAIGTTMVDAIKAFVPGAKSVAFLAPNEDPVTTDLTIIQAAAQKAGLTFYNDMYPFGTTVLSSVLTTMAGQNPSAVIMLDGASDYQLQAPQFASSGVPKTVTMLQYGSDSSLCQSLGQANGYPCIADPDAGVNFSSSTLSSVDSSFLNGFAAYTHKSVSYAVANGIFSTFSYDYAFMLVQAMEKAGTVTNTTKIADALRSVVRSGIVGRLQFNSQDIAQFPLYFSYVPVTGAIVNKSFAP
jgi:branched-chain amino acid transport system substrate-binding protein